MRVIARCLLCFGIFLLLSCSSKKNKDNNQEDAPEDSLATLVREIENAPNDPNLYQKRAIYYSSRLNYSKALEDVQKAISLDSINASYFITLSDIYFATNQTRDSKIALEKAISLDPGNTLALIKLGELYFLIQKYEDAFLFIDKALKIDEHLSKAYFLKGMIFKELKDSSKAISSFITAVEQDQSYYDAYMQLGILHSTKKNNLCIDFISSALKIKPNSEEGMYTRGKYYQNIADWENAIKSYDTLIAIFPNNKFAFFNLGVIYGGEKKEYEKSLLNFNRAIEIDPEYFQAYYGKGSCYEMMNDRKKAIENYTEALKINPNYTPALKSLELLR